MDLQFYHHETLCDDEPQDFLFDSDLSDEETQGVSYFATHSSSLGSSTVLRHQVPPILLHPPVSVTSQSFRSRYHAPGSSDHISSRINILYPAASFPSYTPATLQPLLSDPNTLILDLRPPEAHFKSRLPDALSLSVPSSALMRLHFSTAQLAARTLTTKARDKFSQWRSAHRILVYDIDSSNLQEDSNILSLLRTFRAENALSLTHRSRSPHPHARIAERELAWLKGGFEAVWRECRDIVDIEPLPPLPMTDRRAVDYYEMPDPVSSAIES